MGSADLQVGCRVGLRPAHGLWRRGRRQYSRSGDRRYSDARFTEKSLGVYVRTLLIGRLACMAARAGTRLIAMHSQAVFQNPNTGII